MAMLGILERIDDEVLQKTIRISGLADDSIVDGPGIRFVIFAQGCLMHCPGCHNPQTWDKNGGYDITFGELLSKIDRNPLLSGVTFSGGEPFLQAPKFAHLARLIREQIGIGIISFSGYTYDALRRNSTPENGYLDLLFEIDYLIDGAFVEDKKSYDLHFRGSRNQRFIDVKASLAAGNPVGREEILL
jgi:anaerobic ribonucleoside-triphosphate reductase activating protein